MYFGNGPEVASDETRQRDGEMAKAPTGGSKPGHSHWKDASRWRRKRGAMKQGEQQSCGLADTFVFSQVREPQTKTTQIRAPGFSHTRRTKSWSPVM